MVDEDSQGESTNMRNNIAVAMAILSGLGSIGSLILNLLDASGSVGAAALWFQAFAVLTILLAVAFMSMEWDLRRNKWPGIEERYMQSDLLTTVPHPESTPQALHRMRIETLRKRKRLALAEGKQQLADQYQSEIDEAKKHLNHDE